MQPGLELAPVSQRGLRVGAGSLQGVKAGHLAAPGVQRGNGVHAAHETDVHVQTAGRRVLAQRGQRRVMAGIEHQHVGAVVKGHGQGALDVAAQGFNLRRQARLSLSLGPK